MPTAIKKRSLRKPTLRGLSQAVSRLSSRVEELEDLRDLSAAVARNKGKPGVSWAKAKAALGLD
ncbi:MAG: hypothetical protein ABI273_04040 [Lacunisphaera sp.]